ncbi:MAG: hypothetical protein ACYC6C_11460, partial [Coriobacteriia bacterium]
MNEPTFGSLVVRESLVSRILSAPEGFVGIIAPAGYGKSVVALQVSSDALYDSVIWVDCSWVSDSSAQLSSAVCAALDGRVPGPILRHGDSILPESRVETWVDAAERLSEYSGQVLCFVLDSLNAAFDARDLLSLNLILRRVAARGSKLIVTARTWSSDNCGSMAPYLVTASDLRLSVSEAGKLQDALGTSLHPTIISSAHAACQGQAALLVVLLRHVEREGPPDGKFRSTSGQMTHMLSSMIRTQLDADAIRLLCLCALMQRGQIKDILGFSPNATEAAKHIGHVLPLFRLEGGGVSDTFAVHELLSSFVVENLSEWESLNLGEVIDHAIDALDTTGQVERIFILLELLGSPDLTRDWLLRRGRDLLAVGGLLALARAFDSVSIADTIREPQLLLLQARMMREQAEYEGALKKARVAGELSRCDGDHATAHDAVMLQVRLLMDLGRLEDAADGIREAFLLGVPPGRGSTVVLMHCFMASCLGLTGRLEEAR